MPQFSPCVQTYTLARTNAHPRASTSQHPPTRFSPLLLDSRKSVASTSHANIRASIGETGNPRYAKQPASSLHAPRHSRKLCEAMGTVPPPLMDSRKSVMSANRANMCVPRFDQKPTLSKQLAPPHHDSPTHSQHRNRFSTVENRSRRPRAPSCVQALFTAVSVTPSAGNKALVWPDTQGRKTSRHRSPAIALTVRGSRHTPATLYRWSKTRSRRPTAPLYLQASVCPDT